MLSKAYLKPLIKKFLGLFLSMILVGTIAFTLLFGCVNSYQNFNDSYDHYISNREPKYNSEESRNVFLKMLSALTKEKAKAVMEEAGKDLSNNTPLSGALDQNGVPFDLFQTVTKDGKTLFQLIGEMGATEIDRQEEVTTRIDNLNIAREMETAGKDAKTIRLATGWEKGVDGKWKYEIAEFNWNIDTANKMAEYVTWVANMQAEYTDWVTQQMADYTDWITNQEQTFDEWATEHRDEYDAWILARQLEFQNWYSVHTTNWANDFDTWFESIKNKLSGDIAGSLQNQIDELNAVVSNLEGMLFAGLLYFPSSTDDGDAIITNDGAYLLFTQRICNCNN